MPVFSRRTRLWLGCVGALLLGPAGCGPSLPKNETTYVVHGKVTMDGEPMVGGKLMFSRTDGKPFHGQGKITPEGEYSAFCYAQQAGLVPGEYKVHLDYYAYEPKHIPDKYKNAASSDKTVMVDATENEIDVNFEDNSDAE